MKNLFALFIAALILSPQLSAQAPAAADRRPDLAVEYTYVHSNAPPGGCGCFSLNGGSVSVAQPLGTGHLAAAADMAVTHGSGINAGGYDLTLFSFTSGLRYRPFLRSRWSPFGQVLIGVANAGGTLVEGHSPAAGDSPLNFASLVGGGLDYRLRGPWSVRLIEADYLLTRSTNGVNDHQNNLRVSAGIVLRFGKH